MPADIACNTLWQNMWTHHTTTPNTIPHIYFEILLVSSMECTTWIFLYPLMFVVEICDAISTKRFDVREEHWRDKTLAVC
jgi:hypothetical protein